MTDNRKNVFSYIMWAFFAAIIGLLSYFYVNDYILYDGRLSDIYAELNIILAFIIAIVIGLLFDFIHRKLKANVSALVAGCFRIFEFAAGIIAVFLYRYINFSGIVKTLNSAAIVENHYVASRISGDGRILCDFTSIEGIYNSVISFFFKIFGNSEFGLYIAEQVMMITAIVLIYSSVRMLTGGCGGFVYMITAAFIPLFVIHGDRYSLYFAEYLVFALGMFILGLLKCSLNIRFLDYFMIILASSAVGILYAYTDAGLVLFAGVIVILLSNKEADVADKIFSLIIMLLFNLLSLFICICGEDMVNGYFDSIFKNLAGYVVKRFDLMFSLSAAYDIISITNILVILIIGIIYVIMFFGTKSDYASVYIMMLISSLVVTGCLKNVNANSFRLIIVSLISIVGGMGISCINDIFSPVKSSDEADSLERVENESPESPGSDASTGSVSEDGWEHISAEIPVENKKEEIFETKTEAKAENIKEQAADLKAEPVSEPKAEAKTESVTESKSKSEPQTEKIELFESPIPLPKRVEKRDVDYDYDVPEDMMHYDLKIYDDDF